MTVIYWTVTTRFSEKAKYGGDALYRLGKGVHTAEIGYK